MVDAALPVETSKVVFDTSAPTIRGPRRIRNRERTFAL
jgi:hypothetical protein